MYSFGMLLHVTKKDFCSCYMWQIVNCYNLCTSIFGDCCIWKKKEKKGNFKTCVLAFREYVACDKTNFVKWFFFINIMKDFSTWQIGTFYNRVIVFWEIITFDKKGEKFDLCIIILRDSCLWQKINASFFQVFVLLASFLRQVYHLVRLVQRIITGWMRHIVRCVLTVAVL